MKPWLRLTLITLTVGGGFTGFVGTLPSLLRHGSQQPVLFLMFAGFLALYAFVAASGLLFIQNEKQILPLLIGFAVQVPWISSPVLAYQFTAGFNVSVGLFAGRLGWVVRLGGDWHCVLGQKAAWGAGVNLFALFIMGLLARRLSGSLSKPRDNP
jgi:hypothetical protein